MQSLQSIRGVTDTGPLKGFQRDPESGAFLKRPNPQEKRLKTQMTNLDERVEQLESQLSTIGTKLDKLLDILNSGDE